MKRAIALVGVGGLVGASLAVAPVVLGHDRQDKTATEAAEAAATAVVAAPVDTPTPVMPAGTYNPLQSFSPLVESVEPAVLQIEIDGKMPAPDIGEVPPMFRPFVGDMGPQEMHGEGSGFIVSPDGYVLTNNHVVDHADNIHAKFADGTVVEAKVVGTGPTLDLALLKLDGDKTWPYVRLGESDGLKVGDWVVAVGNPLGLGTTVTAGIVSGKSRVLGHDAFDDFIQTDAAINEGNSGGPLFDLQGNVVGINTAIIAGANTIGFAIPIDLAKGVMDDLRDNGKVSRGYIGVQSEPPAHDEKGAMVDQVVDGTPGAKAGLREGDVIVKVDDHDIDSPAALVRAIGGHDPGDKVTLGVLRDGKSMDVPITLGERPSEEAMAKADQKQEKRGKGAPDDGDGSAGGDPPHLGVMLAPLASDKADSLGIQGGVEVQNVQDGAPADGYLRPGDVILEVNHWPVTSPSEVKQLVETSKDAVILKIVRDGETKNVAVAIP